MVGYSHPDRINNIAEGLRAQPSFSENADYFGNAFSRNLEEAAARNQAQGLLRDEDRQEPWFARAVEEFVPAQVEGFRKIANDPVDYFTEFVAPESRADFNKYGFVGPIPAAMDALEMSLWTHKVGAPFFKEGFRLLGQPFKKAKDFYRKYGDFSWDEFMKTSMNNPAIERKINSLERLIPESSGSSAGERRNAQNIIDSLYEKYGTAPPAWARALDSARPVLPLASLSAAGTVGGSREARAPGHLTPDQEDARIFETQVSLSEPYGAPHNSWDYPATESEYLDELIAANPMKSDPWSSKRYFNYLDNKARTELADFLDNRLVEESLNRVRP